MMSFINSESEIRVCKASNGNKLERIANDMTAKRFNKSVLISFDGDSENISLRNLMYFRIATTYIYHGYPKLKSIFGFWDYRQTIFQVISHAQSYKMMLQLTFNFNDQDLTGKK